MDAACSVDIPKRALFKAAEVCDLAKVQPYVLRSWEAEFPGLGVAKPGGAARTYRREDIEQVLRIKHLLLVEGLTLAGARRKLEEEGGPAGGDEAVIAELIGKNARERLTAVKRGLRSILDMLSETRSDFHLVAPPTHAAKPAAARAAAPVPARAKAVRGKAAAPAKNGSARAPHARRGRR